VNKPVLLTILCLVFSTSSCGAGPDQVHDAVLDEFRCYRIALDGDDGERILRHFSAPYLSEWLASLLYVDSLASEHNLSSVRGNVSIGEGINFVHQYSLSKLGDDRYALKVDYSKSRQGGLRTLSLVYIADGDRYLIDGMDVHFYDVPKTTERIVDNFSSDDSPECSRQK